jgi:hypothetical protein
MHWMNGGIETLEAKRRINQSDRILYEYVFTEKGLVDQVGLG